MTREELEKLGLTKEQADSVLAAYGKGIQAEQEKAKTAVDEATKPLKEQIVKHGEQVKELEEKIKSSTGVDEKSKNEIAELQKAHAEAIKELENKAAEAQIAHTTQLVALQREAETRDFLSSLGKKFITPETQKAFEQSINTALTDKVNEGKNRADIFAALVKGADGKERTDIFVAGSTAKPPATGATGDLPGDGAVYTLEQVKAMTPEQINNNWEAVQKTLQGGAK